MQALAQHLPRIDGSLLILFSEFAPPPRQQPSHPLDGLAHAQPRGRVKCACPIKTILKFSVPGSRAVVAVADDGGLQIRLPVLTGRPVALRILEVD